jgi:hypothetical protein
MLYITYKDSKNKAAALRNLCGSFVALKNGKICGINGRYWENILIF